MSKKQRGELKALILQSITQFGPMTRVEIEKHIGEQKGGISAVIARIRQPQKTIPKLVYIKTYVHDHENERTYPRAVYAIGNKPDAKRPAMSRLEIRRRYDAKRKKHFTMNSVFNLSKTREQIRNELRGTA